MRIERFLNTKQGVLRQGVPLPNPKPGDQFIASFPEPSNGGNGHLIWHAEITGLTSEIDEERANLIVEGRYPSAARVRDLRRGRWGDCIIELAQNNNERP